MNEIELKYNEFWKEIVENTDGSINKSQVMKELYDYSVVMDNASKVYWYITDGKISKPNTLYQAVVGESDQCEYDRNEQQKKELLYELKHNFSIELYTKIEEIVNSVL